MTFCICWLNFLIVFIEFMALAAVMRGKEIGKNSKTDFTKVKGVQHSFQLPVMCCTLSGILIQKYSPCAKKLKWIYYHEYSWLFWEWNIVQCSTFSRNFWKIVLTWPSLGVITWKAKFECFIIYLKKIYLMSVGECRWFDVQLVLWLTKYGFLSF